LLKDNIKLCATNTDMKDADASLQA